MQAFRAHSRLIGWIAALALQLALLAPSLSHALADRAAGEWTDVCTAQGLLSIEAAAGHSEGAPSDAHVLEQCPCCLLQAQLWGLPSADTPAVQPQRSVGSVASRDLAAPRTRSVRVRAQPRAPPPRA